MSPLHFAATRQSSGFGSIRVRIPDDLWLRQPTFKGSDALDVAGGVRSQILILFMFFGLRGYRLRPKVHISLFGIKS